MAEISLDAVNSSLGVGQIEPLDRPMTCQCRIIMARRIGNGHGNGDHPAIEFLAIKGIYLGMMQFMVIQLIGLTLIFMFPQIALWLPNYIYGQ